MKHVGCIVLPNRLRSIVEMFRNIIYCNFIREGTNRNTCHIPHVVFLYEMNIIENCKSHSVIFQVPMTLTKSHLQLGRINLLTTSDWIQISLTWTRASSVTNLRGALRWCRWTSSHRNGRKLVAQLQQSASYKYLRRLCSCEAVRRLGPDLC